MAYNPVAQADDTMSEFSEIRASPINAQSPARKISSSFDPSSEPSESSTRHRTVSRDGSGPMECPTPDLQSLQGAYISNVERLEQSAERLSMSSDIGEEIRKIREDQKRSDSRRSSILNPHLDESRGSPILHRQLSYGYGSHASNSIVGTNSVARSGGFSAAAYFASPRSSVRSGSWSHHNSVKGRSASQEPRLTQVSEPEQEGKPLDSPMSTRFAPLPAAPKQPSGELRMTNDGQYNLNDVIIPQQSPELELAEYRQSIVDDMHEPRPSTDTARQVNGLFSDFDGVHTVAQVPESPLEDLPSEIARDHRRSSQMLEGRPHSFLDPTPGEDMVYYPAPVPMMLNLPKRLSKLPGSSQRDRRRSEMLSHLPDDARKSAPWLPGMLEASDERHVPLEDEPSHNAEHKRRTMAALPPQLRASMFFDYPATHQDIELKGDSAVATLDSILDASAYAPVSAFTDHPIVGQMGADVYSRTPAKMRANYNSDPRVRSSTIDLTKRNSRGDLLDDTKKRNSLMSIGNYFGRRKSSNQQLGIAADSQEPDAIDEATLFKDSADHMQGEEDEYVQSQEEAGEAPQDVEQDPQPFEGQPTTLLAELQLRKQQQKLRNRTAATAFPDGMHATLLQLDAVAQVQKNSRNQKQTTLAWEDPAAHPVGLENEDDEDVPLGMLYPGQQMQKQMGDEQRPLGLIAKRQMEDNEPLSHRRARLRGEDPSIRNLSFVQHNILDYQDVNLVSGVPNEDEDEDDPGETLGQRIRRIKATQIPVQPRPISNDFASEIMSQFGGIKSNEESQKPASKLPMQDTVKTPDLEEETLGQRRKRLQAEAIARSRNVSGESNGVQATRPPLSQRRSMADLLQAHPAAGAGIRSLSNELKFAPAPKTRNTAWAMQMNQQVGLGQISALAGAAAHMTGVASGGYAPHPMVAGRKRDTSGEKELRKGDMIDRWRQSVMY